MDTEHPFESVYEKVKQSIITYASVIAQQNDIPVQILNLIMYEIGIESRMSTYSALIGACDVGYPEQKDSNTDENIKSVPETTLVSKDADKTKTVTVSKEDTDKIIQKLSKTDK